MQTFFTFKELHMSREDALSAQEGGWRLVAISPSHPTLCFHLLNRDGGNKTDKNKKNASFKRQKTMSLVTISCIRVPIYFVSLLYFL
jgi:hypothetical protein